MGKSIGCLCERARGDSNTFVGLNLQKVKKGPFLRSNRSRNNRTCEYKNGSRESLIQCPPKNWSQGSLILGSQKLIARITNPTIIKNGCEGHLPWDHQRLVARIIDPEISIGSKDHRSYNHKANIKRDHATVYDPDIWHRFDNDMMTARISTVLLLPYNFKTAINDLVKLQLNLETHHFD